ncbi:DUF397 domain-containing protein [Nocardiopsis sp. EMB25]|uniref:DUF397 domain-containing protein n=1 Tax=Nocardiopsis sp. EMB25 TaxID=2835867 RepID=UPI002284B5C6|nr:DUF397 domain-containing protein [Nocardiopsis sp. EMB25]MCY9785449.1 DUF397 domain-containing protein [Nocardiopsis sp. EMB25]
MRPTTNLTFRKSSHSDRSDCVEVADLLTGAAVRDTRNRQLGHISFVDSAEWRAFLAAVQQNTK